jgi:molybdopterin molybdotransferase
MAPATVDDHAKHVAGLLETALHARGAERVPLDAALGRLTAHPVLSPVDLPLFRNSQMDGFAVHADDVAVVPCRLRVVGEIAAGTTHPHSVGGRGQAVRIMTGAALPHDADAIVPVEDTVADGEDGVLINRSRSVGEYVRERGSDVRAGQKILDAGTLLAPRHLGILAAVGLDGVEVRAKVRVAVITTGDELVVAGAVPQRGQVFDSNGVSISAAVRAADAEMVFRSHVIDEPALMLTALSQAASIADLIITSGGISMGAYEVVREVIEPLGGRVGTVAMQPGGPQATALVDGVPVVCFPGNPVSSQLSFEVFVAPLLREAAGLPNPARLPRELAHPIRSVLGKRQFLRGRTIESGLVEQVSGPGSHLVAALAAADVLIVVPENVVEIEAGEMVETWML